MKLYVSSSWEERQVAQELMQNLRNRGHVITHDWTNETQEWHSQKIEDAVDYAAKVTNAILEADAFILALDGIQKMGVGCAIEYGYALAVGAPIIVYGAQKTANNPLLYAGTNQFLRADLTYLLVVLDAINAKVVTA